MPTPSYRRPQRGFILVMGMMFMLMCTLLGLAMFRSFGLQERVAGNTRDKQRAFEAAQTTLQYGEWWLRSGADTTPVAIAALPPTIAFAPRLPVSWSAICIEPPLPRQ